MRRVTKKVKLMLLLFCIASNPAQAQNLNNPNKTGPLGTQVNTYSGNLFIPRTDLYIPARAFDIDISFYYNSFLYNEDYGFGKGWTFQYNIRYSHDTTPGNRLILWGDGREDKYDSIAGGGYRSPRGFFSKLVQYQPGKYVLTETDSTKYFFNNSTHKRITRMEEPNGNFINFSYTDSLLTSLVNAAGQTITFTYDVSGRLATLTDALVTPVRTFTYTYDVSGNLKEVKDPLNGKYKYSYLVNGPMKTITDRNNNTVDIIYFPDFTASELIGCNKRISFSYDSTSRTTVVTDHLSAGNNQVTTYKYKKLDNLAWLVSKSGNCCGFNMSFEFDDEGNKIKETDANGNVYTFTYDDKGNMLTATDPLGQTSTYTYSATYNKITSYKDAKGNRYTIGYDGKGNMVQIVMPGNQIYTATYNATGDIISSTDPKGNVFTYNYDAYGNPVFVSGPNGYHAALSFDARGNLLAHTDARGNTNVAEYDILSRLKKITDPINNSVQANYDAEGNMVSFTGKNNETGTISYDASNRPVIITGPTGNKSVLVYDGMDNITGVKNALGHETTFSYDTRNRLKGIKDPESNTAAYSYDGNGNVTGISLPNGQTIHYSYDKLNRITSVSDAAGNVASLTYDQNSNVTSYTNGTGATVSATYDSLNRVKQLTDALGNSISMVYDKNHNITAVTDRNGFTRQYSYDSLDRVKTYTDNNGFIISVGYDAQGNIAQLTDQNNNTTTYTYDSLNRRKTMTYPDGKFMQYGYDKKGNIISKRLTDGTTIAFQYDTLNRVIVKTLPGAQIFTYGYDALNRVTSASNNNGTVIFTYDALNRVTSETFDGRTTRYAYSISGRTQTTIYPDSATVIKEFDTRNRLVKTSKDGKDVATYQYNNANQLTAKNFANGTATTLQYDFANRLSNITTGTIQNTSFTYDKEGNKKTISRLNNPSLSEEFTYDNGYRITNYKRGVIGGTPSVQNTYTYDAVGNRTAANLGGANTTYVVNNLNQLTNVNGTAFIYDNRGNLTYDGVFYKTYDAENRLIKDSASPASVLVYGYDALNRRVLKTTNGTTLKYTYSGMMPIEERSASNTLLTRTVFNGFLSPVMNERNGNNYYFHQNELNSVEAITGANGSLTEQYRYDAYGKPSRYDSLNNTLAASIAGNRFGLTGQEYDSATNSYRFFYRNYSPATGTFNQRDLIEYEDGMGMYQYVGNNPANGVDVLGLQTLAPEGPQCSISADLEVNKTKSLKDEILSIGGDWVSNITSVTAMAWESAAQSTPIKILNNPLLSVALLPINAMNTEATVSDLAMNWDSKSAAQKTSGIIDAGSGAVFTGMGAATTYTLVSEGMTGAAGMFGGVTGSTAVGATGATGVFLPVAGGLAIYGLINAGVKAGTGKSISENAETWEIGCFTNPIRNFYSKDEWDESYYKENGLLSQWYAAQIIMEKRIEYNKYGCAQGGSRKFQIAYYDPTLERWVTIYASLDPNEIIGPAGQSAKKWVSVKDRLPYTINFENDTTANAPAKYVKVATPVEPKQDASTLLLGSFGFNNLSFTVPDNTTSYYQRLDCRDSMGLYVDITAGFDPVKNEIFWEFQSIDPITLLPPEDPLVGFLFVRDTANTEYGKGFVNFSLKPMASANTLDTIGARAFIVFDINDTVPTNIHTNTIDAVAPTSSITALPGLTPDTEVNLHFTGMDDAGGSGVKWYSIYISDNNAPPELYISNFSKADTTFRGLADHVYKFYISATDTAGNQELLKLVDSVKISSGEYVICPGSNIAFDARVNGSLYQWQVNNGVGYTNISNGGIYSGANNPVLHLANAPTSMYGYQYRCLVNGSVFSEVFLLKFGMSWEGTVSTAWENAANWSCNSVPDANTDVIVDGNKARYPQVNSNVIIRSLRMNPGSSGTVNTGFTLTVIK